MLIYPSISYLKDRESRLRFQEVSIFNNLEPVKIANARIALDNDSRFAKLIHNRRILFAADFLKHYFDNFSGRFLFTHRDRNPRLSVQDMGELYVWDLIFLLIGIFMLVKNREKSLPVLLLWMAIVPIPAATARETPHALRILSILPTSQIITAYGVHQLWIIVKRRFSTTTYRFLLSVICFLLSFNIFYYLHNYYIHYPIVWEGEWQYGYKQMVSYVLTNIDKYDHVFVTESLGRPYIYFAFYKPYHLADFLNERQANRDWFGFWDVSALGKIEFGFDELGKTPGRVLLVTTPGNIPNEYHLIATIYNLKGDEVFVIAEK